MKFMVFVHRPAGYHLAYCLPANIPGSAQRYVCKLWDAEVVAEDLADAVPFYDDFASKGVQFVPEPLVLMIEE